MKIIQILHGENYGGLELFCINLTNELSKYHEVVFMGSTKFHHKISNNVKFISLDMSKKRYNLLYLYRLYKIISGFMPDIIHVHKQKSIYMMKYLSLFLKIPFVATKHDTFKKSAYTRKALLKYAISATDDMDKTLKVEHIFRVSYGIQFVAPRKIQLSNKFNIVAVGGLRAVKGYDNLINALSQISFDYHLYIIGEGDERKNLEKLITSLGLGDKITLVGFSNNVNDYIYSSDLQVISSHSEGFSLAMIEGIFYGKVLISTKVSGSKDILFDELLYDIGDLPDKIRDVYANYAKYVNFFSDVKRKYKDELTIEGCAKKHAEVYREIVEDYSCKR